MGIQTNSLFSWLYFIFKKKKPSQTVKILFVTVHIYKLTTSFMVVKNAQRYSKTNSNFIMILIQCIMLEVFILLWSILLWYLFLCQEISCENIALIIIFKKLRILSTELGWKVIKWKRRHLLPLISDAFSNKILWI